MHFINVPGWSFVSFQSCIHERASDGKDFYFGTPDINGDSRGPSLFLVFLCATATLRLARRDLFVLRAFC